MKDAKASPWRVLDVDVERCIGCRACSSLWDEISLAPALSEEGPQRWMRFPRVFEEFEARIAESLAEVCPTGAISVTLAHERPLEEGIDLAFNMIRCRRCKTPFATEEEVKYIRERIPEDLRAQNCAVSWMELCPGCRRWVGRKEAARELIVVRSGARR
jgi:ferredoxin